jgi:hypothetical protein
MKYYEASSRIAASPEAVWRVLVDGARWPAWDSGVDSVEGTIAPGHKLTIRAAGGGARAFPVKVVAFDSLRKLVFRGGMPLGLFRGIRTYTVNPDGAGTRFRMREEYSGVLLPAIWKSIPDLGPSFHRFAAGLKARVESGA